MNSRYFFDVEDGLRLIRDETGMLLPNEDIAMREAFILLDQMGDRTPAITISVRDHDGHCFYDVSTLIASD